MSRSKWKGLFIEKSIIQLNKKKKRKLKTYSRSSCIPSFLINKFILIYDGKEFRKCYINREKIGFKFGEFSYSRKKNEVKKNSRKIKKNKKYDSKL
jgi:small subunit ribosomal protein S19